MAEKTTKTPKDEALDAVNHLRKMLAEKQPLTGVREVIFSSTLVYLEERIAAIPVLQRVRRKTEHDVWLCLNRHINPISSPICETCGEAGPGTDSETPRHYAPGERGVLGR